MHEMRQRTKHFGARTLHTEMRKSSIQDMALIQACLQECPKNIEYVQCPIGSRNSAIHNA